MKEVQRYWNKGQIKREDFVFAALTPTEDGDPFLALPSTFDLRAGEGASRRRCWHARKTRRARFSSAPWWPEEARKEERNTATEETAEARAEAGGG